LILSEEYLTLAEVAAALKVKPKTVSNMIAKGIFREGIHFVRPAGLGTRFKQTAIERWLEGDGEKEPGITFPVRAAIGDKWAARSK
jgi:excisionase family DNA binding protein